MAEKELSDFAEESSDFVDEHLYINKRVAGTGFLHVSRENGHLNLIYESNNMLHQIKIPDARAKISDTKYGLVASI